MQLAQARQALSEARQAGAARPAPQPDSRNRTSREELRRVDKESARLKREITRMRAQLEATVQDENVSRLHNLITERSKEHEALLAENRLLERQLQQLRPDDDEDGLSEQRALSDEQAQLSGRVKKYQKLQRMDDQRRQKLQKEFSQAAVRAERLRRELKAEQVRRLPAAHGRARPSAQAALLTPSAPVACVRLARAQERAKRTEKQLAAGFMSAQEGAEEGDEELAAELQQLASLEKRLAATRKGRAGEDKRAKIRARDVLAELAAVRREKERLQEQLEVRRRAHRTARARRASSAAKAQERGPLLGSAAPARRTPAHPVSSAPALPPPRAQDKQRLLDENNGKLRGLAAEPSALSPKPLASPAARAPKGGGSAARLAAAAAAGSAAGLQEYEAESAAAIIQLTFREGKAKANGASPRSASRAPPAPEPAPPAAVPEAAPAPAAEIGRAHV